MYLSNKKVLKIGYYLISVDGVVESQELAKWMTFASSYPNFTKSGADSIIIECQNLISQEIRSGGDLFCIIKEAVRGELYSYLTSEEKIAILWMMVSLSYADGNCCENEKNLISFVMKELQVNESILLELFETAEALEDIENYFAFLDNKGVSHNEIEKAKAEAGKNQQYLIQSIHNLQFDIVEQ